MARDRLDLAWRGVRPVVLVALPFLLLVRGAVVAHRYLDAPGWIAVALGVVLGGACATAVAARLGRRRPTRARVRAIAGWLVAPAALAFSIYSIGWLGHATAKSPTVAASWSELHPVLRLAIGTARLADDGVTVTEIGRERADYARMGLPTIRNSLHYVQGDGWVHAVDLRTRGRGPVRNALTHAWFFALGFDTLRHAGTADHLHVALPRRRG